MSSSPKCTVMKTAMYPLAYNLLWTVMNIRDNYLVFSRYTCCHGCGKKKLILLWVYNRCLRHTCGSKTLLSLVTIF